MDQARRSRRKCWRASPMTSSPTALSESCAYVSDGANTRIRNIYDCLRGGVLRCAADQVTATSAASCDQGLRAQSPYESIRSGSEVDRKQSTAAHHHREEDFDVTYLGATRGRYRPSECLFQLDAARRDMEGA